MKRRDFEDLNLTQVCKSEESEDEGSDRSSGGKPRSEVSWKKYHELFPMFKYADLDNKLYFGVYCVLRFFMVMRCSYGFVHADQYWQSTEVAYDMVYGGCHLPWEWNHDQRIRSVLYPFYLSLPIRLLQALGIDYYWTIRDGYQVAQFFLVMLGDYYFFKVSQMVLGKKGAQISMIFYICSKFLNMHLIKCFGNSVETIFSIVMFYYYFRITDKFDRNIAIFAFLGVLSFMIRCTSIIGWIPLVVI